MLHHVKFRHFNGYSITMTFIADITENYFKVGSGVILGAVLIWLVVKVNTRSPLKNINGPPSDSWLTGELQ